MDMFLFGLVVLAIGIWTGHRTEARKWRLNADQVMRIESGGRLYKVSYDERSFEQVKEDYRKRLRENDVI